MSSSQRAGGFLVLASLLPTASVAAQGARPNFGVAASLTVPTGDYHGNPSGDGFNRGWQGMAFVAFRPPRWPVGLRVDGTYGENGANDQLKTHLTASLPPPSDEKTKLLGANADVTYQLRSASRVEPYVLGGIGIYHVTIALASGGATADNSDTRFAWNLGAGVNGGFGGFAQFLEARYVAVQAVQGFPETSFFALTLGIRLRDR
jgi:opacity protein-like surface antigen